MDRIAPIDCMERGERTGRTMKNRELEIPSLLLDAMRDGVWPKGRIRGALSTLPQPSAGLLADMDLVLLQTRDDLELGASEAASIQSLHEFADSAELSEKFKVKRGSVVTRPVELPWLDVEQALLIGGGADYGDDTWLVLDYRTGPTDPRVVVNVWRQGAPPQVEWCELTPSLTGFLRLLGVADQTG